MSERDMDITAIGSDEDFISHYQFDHDPFAARTPGFKFFTPQRKTVLAELHHLARFGDKILLVTGPQGSGKTLLRQVLVASSNKDTTQCVVATAREFSADTALLGYLCQAVNAKGRSADSLLLRAEQLKETGVQLYLIIDDAQLLEQPALQELVDMTLSSGTDPLLRLFLFADDEVEQAIRQVDAEADRGQWLHQIELQPYTREETRDYIALRLEAAGQGIELLDDEQLQTIYQRSGGWPGRINRVAREVMQDAMEEVPVRTPRAAAGLPTRSIVAVLLIAIGIGIAWWMGGDRQDREPVRTVLQLPETVVPVEAEVDPQLAQLREFNALTAEPPVVVTPPAQVAPEPSADVAEEPVVAVAPPSPVSQPAPQREVPAERPAQVVAPAPAPARAPEPAPEPARRDQQTPPAAAAPTASRSQPHTTDWYRQAAAGDFTLQLLGSRSRDAALSFINANPGLTDVGYFETVHEGQPWFVVTQGKYTSRQQAQQGVASLPASIRQQNPWPRSMSSIQQSLR
ncbi:MAG: AAA family ATPase [Pseudomonas sp.]